MTRLLLIACMAWTGFVMGHIALSTGLAIPELTARAAKQARW